MLFGILRLEETAEILIEKLGFDSEMSTEEYGKLQDKLLYIYCFSRNAKIEKKLWKINEKL